MEIQTLNQNEIDETKPITFAPREWFFFKEEIKNQLAEGNSPDFLKALHNARYFAEISRRTEKIKAGHYVEHDLIEDNDDE